LQAFRGRSTPGELCYDHPWFDQASRASAACVRAGGVGAGPTAKVHGGFEFTEGPASDGHGNLYFSDIPTNRIYRLDQDGRLSILLEPSGHANGLMLNAAGTLFACQMDGQVVAIDLETKKVTVVAGQYQDKRFNAPNDLVLDRTGGIYFSDPQFRAPQPLPQGIEAVYYVAPDNSVARLLDNLPAPNGVILSPDEKTLYVAPSAQKEVWAYPIESPGKLGQGRVFCTVKQADEKTVSGGDGLTIDAAGNLYVATALGLQVFAPDGNLLGVLACPEQPANVTFGGPELTTLYVTARTSLYSLPMQAKGCLFPGGERR
jgi:gluconolactonase